MTFFLRRIHCQEKEENSESIIQKPPVQNIIQNSNRTFLDLKVSQLIFLFCFHVTGKSQWQSKLIKLNIRAIGANLPNYFRWRRRTFGNLGQKKIFFYRGIKNWANLPSMLGTIHKLRSRGTPTPPPPPEYVVCGWFLLFFLFAAH